jgi:hypothetical protein
MKTISFFALVALTVALTVDSTMAQQRPYDYSYPNKDRNNNYDYNSPNTNNSSCNNLQIDDLQREVYFKINRGMETGALNRREAQRLSHAFGEIEQKGRYFRADGFLSRREEQELRNDLLALNEAIRYEKNDDDYRRGGNRRDNSNRRNYRSW